MLDFLKVENVKKVMGSSHLVQLQEVTKVTAALIAEHPFWRDMVEVYLANEGAESYVRIPTTVINAIVTQGSEYLTLTRDGLRDLCKKDLNWTEPPGFTDKQYAFILKTLYKLGILKLVREGNGKQPSVFKVVQPKILSLMGVSQEEAARQLERAEAFVLRKKKTKSNHKTNDNANTAIQTPSQEVIQNLSQEDSQIESPRIIKTKDSDERRDSSILISEAKASVEPIVNNEPNREMIARVPSDPALGLNDEYVESISGKPRDLQKVSDDPCSLVTDRLLICIVRALSGAMLNRESCDLFPALLALADVGLFLSQVQNDFLKEHARNIFSDLPNLPEGFDFDEFWSVKFPTKEALLSHAEKDRIQRGRQNKAIVVPLPTTIENVRPNAEKLIVQFTKPVIYEITRSKKASTKKVFYHPQREFVIKLGVQFNPEHPLWGISWAYKNGIKLSSAQLREFKNVAREAVGEQIFDSNIAQQVFDEAWAKVETSDLTCYHDADEVDLDLAKLTEQEFLSQPNFDESSNAVEEDDDDFADAETW